MIRVLPLLAVAACAPINASAPTSGPTEIRYQAGACFGRCPMYSVTVDSNGRGTFEGERFTAVTGMRIFTATPAQFAAFRSALGEALSANPKDFEPGGLRCQMQATDHPSATLTIREGNSPPRTIRFDYGCRDDANTGLFSGLRRAPDELPIAEFIGKR